jgi:hypothetical protein
MLVAGAAAALALAGCGDDSAPAPELAPAAVHEAPARVRDAGSFAFTAAYTREMPERRPERYLTFEGAVDLREGAGRLHADLSGLFAAPEGPPPPARPLELRWTRERLTAVLDGEEQTRGRDDARTGSGLIGRLPDEPTGVLELLEHAQGVRRAGGERVAGVATARFAAHVDPARSGGAVPAEFGLGLDGLLAEQRLPLQVWLDSDRLPRRIELLFRLRPLGGDDVPVLPARSVRAVYELSRFGRPVE